MSTLYAQPGKFPTVLARMFPTQTTLGPQHTDRCSRCGRDYLQHRWLLIDTTGQTVDCHPLSDTSY